MQFEFSATINKQQTLEVKKWLIEEQQTRREGFYCHWKIIESAILQHKAFGLVETGKVIGFLTRNEYEAAMKIDIMEIHPEYRGKRAGSYLWACARDYLVSQGFLVADVECAPPTSEHFWRQQGFSDFPAVSDEAHHSFMRGEIRLYCPLVPALESETGEPSQEWIDLWDVEPHEARQFPPKWSWPLVYAEQARKLAKPIIHPCHRDWQVRWRKGEVAVKETKAKRFLGENTHQGDFIIIRELPVN